MANTAESAVPAAGSVAAMAGDVWRQMAEFTWSRMQRGPAFHALKTLGLTPGHLKVLAALQPDEALPMGSLAEMLDVDPSMATWLIDRLEERKLVERKMLTTDRRVKVVTLTKRGVRVKTKVLAQVFEPPAELLELDPARLKALQSALKALPKTERPFTTRGRQAAARNHHHRRTTPRG